MFQYQCSMPLHAISSMPCVCFKIMYTSILYAIRYKEGTHDEMGREWRRKARWDDKRGETRRRETMREREAKGGERERRARVSVHVEQWESRERSERESATQPRIKKRAPRHAGRRGAGCASYIEAHEWFRSRRNEKAEWQVVTRHNCLHGTIQDSNNQK